MKNKSMLGLAKFIQAYYEDAQAGVLGDWWNESYGRRGEKISVKLNGQVLTTVYDLIEYLKKNYADVTQEELDEVKDYVSRIYMALNYRRVYRWEVSEIKEEDSKEKASTQKLDFSDKEEEQKEEEVQAEEEPIQEEQNKPDFDHAKSIKSKKELKEYAKDFGFDLDSRKSLSDMMKSFQGKYHASKNK